MCAGETATLEISGADTYTWNSGSNASSVIITPVVTTIYSVKGTGNNGCTAIALITQSVEACTGISAYAKQDIDFSIYPNPGNGTFFIRLENYENASLRVYTICGQEIFKTAISDRISSFDISTQPNGIYFIELKQEKNISRIKVLKQ